MTAEAVPYHLYCAVLSNLYLEDSYVLNIAEKESSINFDMEFVLTEEHELYQSPKKNEQYCYSRGQLNFLDCSSTSLQLSNNLTSIDADGEQDIGNIDFFVNSNGNYLLEGDWGNLKVKCASVSVTYKTEPTP